MAVDGPENGVSLSARGRLKNLPFKAPKISNVSTEHEVGCVHKKDLPFGLVGLSQPRYQLHFVKLELKLMIGFSWSWNALAQLYARLLDDASSLTFGKCDARQFRYPPHSIFGRSGRVAAIPPEERQTQTGE
jgi:hypothetical protein